MPDAAAKPKVTATLTLIHSPPSDGPDLTIEVARVPCVGEFVSLPDAKLCKVTAVVVMAPGQPDDCHLFAVPASPSDLGASVAFRRRIGI